jgi:hypothetical protein
MHTVNGLYSSNNSSVTIIGGGMSGLLLALRLSRDPNMCAKGITIFEKQPHFGGRFFFSSYHPPLNNSSDQFNYKQLKLSGPGFEWLEGNTLEIMYRHFESHLSELEKNEVDLFFQDTQGKVISQKKQCFFVKKDFVSDSQLFAGSSEIFTKKEAETFKSFIFDNFNNINEEHNNKNSLNINFEKSEFWASLAKSTKEAFTPFFATIVGPNWEKASFIHIHKLFKDFFNSLNFQIPPCFFREHYFEFVVESILKKRGVVIRTDCEVMRVHHDAKSKFEMLLSDKINPAQKTFTCQKLIFAIPLVKCLSLLSKEHFSPSQSRFVSKVKPVSLIFSEITDFLKFKCDHWPENASLGDRFVFPVEKVMGFLTHDGRMILSIKLDYEDSLQAPAVRDAVARLRRAATRILNPEFSEDLKKGARIPENKISEKIILLPVAYTIPCDTAANIEVKETKMGIDGMYCCGDSFPGFANEPWKMIINSVYDVAAQLSQK